MISRFLLALLIATAFAATGCESIKYVATSVLPNDEAKNVQYDPHIYPAQTPLGDELALEIKRTDRKHIRIENRTAVPYANVQVWINEEYGATLENLPVGDSGPIALVQFINQFGEQFPVGSFLEPEKASAIVAGVILVDEQLHPINVMLPKNWRYR